MQTLNTYLWGHIAAAELGALFRGRRRRQESLEAVWQAEIERRRRLFDRAIKLGADPTGGRGAVSLATRTIRREAKAIADYYDDQRDLFE